MEASRFGSQRRRWWLAGWCLLTLWVATAWADPGWLNGRVVAAETSEPLVGASVRVTGPALTGERGAYTDGQGRYAVVNLPPGTYRVAATFVGYQEQVVEGVEVVAGQAVTVDLRLIVAPYGLDEIVVSASRHTENVVDAPVSISKVNAKEIERNAAGHSFSSLLRHVRGVDYTQTGMFAEAFNIRGFNLGFNTRMVTLLDGVPHSPPAGMTIAVPFAKDDLQDMEVIAGPGSALYGPDAVAGIVSLTTKDPRTSQGTSVAVATGSRSLAVGRVRHAGLHGRWGWKLAVEHSQAQDFEKVNTFYNADSSLSVTDEPDLDTRSTRGTTGIYYYPDDRSSLAIKVGRSRSDLINMMDSGRFHEKNMVSSYEQLTFTSPHVHANLYRFVVDEEFGYTLHGYAQNRLAGMAPAEARVAAGWTGSATFWGGEARYTGALALLDGVRFNLGTDLRREEDKTTIFATPTAEVHQVGVYGYAETDLNRYLRITLAGREDFPKTYDPQFSPRIAVICRPRPEMALRLSMNQAYRSPNINHQYMALALGPNVYARGNLHGFRFGSESGAPLPAKYADGIQSVSPERSTTYEAGFKGTLANRVFLDLTAYTSRYRDFISPATPISDPENGIVILDEDGNLRAGELTYTYLNYGKRTVRGLDLGANLYLGRQLLLRGNVSFVHAEPLEAAAGFTQPFNTPGSILNLTLSANDLLRKGTTADLSLRHVSEFDFRTVGHVGTVSAYTVLDLSLACPLRPGAVIRATVKNLLNHDHVEFIDAPRIGRVLVAEMTYSL